MRPYWIIVVILSVCLAGCMRSPPTHFYLLSSEAKAVHPATTALPMLWVGPVNIPPALDRPELVIKRGKQQVSFLETQRWAAPLSKQIAAVVAQNLSTELGQAVLTQAQSITPQGAFYWISIDVKRFDLEKNTVQLQVVWNLYNACGPVLRYQETRNQQTVEQKDYSALVFAQSRAIAVLSTDIATALRALAGQRSRCS